MDRAAEAITVTLSSELLRFLTALGMTGKKVEVKSVFIVILDGLLYYFIFY